VIGNVHCLRSGTAAVDLALLRRIGEAVDRPLVLHGGSGFPAAAIAEAIDCGVAKFNIGTALKVAYRDAMQQALDNAGDRVDIHDLFGRGTATDAMAAGRIAVKERVLDFMKLYNCTGKA
jgi:fructose-bisphosphate aldolase class II